ncbi:hypothetical protein D5045_10670 [Verminephrobacter eiseniae]|nr:hypothetical protein [Verminephrobacter eiseniae]
MAERWLDVIPCPSQSRATSQRSAGKNSQALRRLGRQLPELPADLLFDADEWHGAYILNRKKPPKEVPALNTVVRLVAQLGGFLGRKHDGELGAKTLCLGLREITIFVQSARFARDAGTCV